MKKIVIYLTAILIICGCGKDEFDRLQGCDIMSESVQNGVYLNGTMIYPLRSMHILNKHSYVNNVNNYFSQVHLWIEKLDESIQKGNDVINHSDICFVGTTEDTENAGNEVVEFSKFTVKSESAIWHEPMEIFFLGPVISGSGLFMRKPAKSMT